jgi:hypothetical protein
MTLSLVFHLSLKRQRRTQSKASRPSCVPLPLAVRERWPVPKDVALKTIQVARQKPDLLENAHKVRLY